MASLKSFIKAVRKAKTIADERSVVRKESASIRTSFRDPNLDQTTRRINISKLLYLYIMGEKTHFGQVECLKLLSSPRFADKRLGYLATMLLLDENQEVLTLLTNSLDNDMQHPNSFIVGLALCCLGNIASPELARDLYSNVDKIITTNNLYLKKKACLVAAKLIEKDPDLAEIFLPKVAQLIEDKHHSTLLGVTRLIQIIYEVDLESRPTLVKLIPKLIAHLKRIATSGYMPDYDVLGISDPFLQVSILKTLRMLAVDSACSSANLEQLNDVLTQVTSNIESSNTDAGSSSSGKNAGHSILYECVKTIFAIQSDQSLKILGVNLLGKFLSTKDNNIRYVALDALLTVISIEPMAVQRHRATIVGCLLDGDISIRRRALELTFAILNEQNIRLLVREVLLFLEACTDNDLKPYITSQLVIASNKYAPNDKWHFDTLIRMLKVSGNYVTMDILSNILALIMQCKDMELRKHVVGKVLSLSLENQQQQYQTTENGSFGLSLVTIWCLGEYGELIMGGNIEVNGKSVAVTEKLILKLIEDLLNNSNFTDSETVSLVTYILTTVLKLSVKFQDERSIEQLRLILSSKSYDNNIEIQIRAIEYQEIFASNEKLKKGLLAKMPAPPMKEREALSLHPKSAKKQQVSLSGSGSGSGSTTTTDDLLLDLMDDGPVPENSAAAADNNNYKPDSIANRNANILDLFDNPSQSNTSTSNPIIESSSSIPAFSSSLISVSFSPKSFKAGQAVVEAYIVAKSPGTHITQFQLLIAVPKSQKLSITSTSGDYLDASNSTIKQVLKIVGKEGAKIKLRVKVKYVANNETIEDTFDFAGFENTL
ncbi:AP-1 complex subunit gamma-1 [[Candida] railenensis]|uniref:AP-1 complex subunit gamma n=1 Tax=[Candida] railenensis TaxID=45579 RepID=A0A9P0QUG7_9ASCO|nr:AP-1 complex subunit gamma-1 [[Candida] railenensis]